MKWSEFIVWWSQGDRTPDLIATSDTHSLTELIPRYISYALLCNSFGIVKYPTTDSHHWVFHYHRYELTQKDVAVRLHIRILLQ